MNLHVVKYVLALLKYLIKLKIPGAYNVLDVHTFNEKQKSYLEMLIVYAVLYGIGKYQRFYRSTYSS